MTQSQETVYREVLALRTSFESGSVGASLFPCLDENEVLAFEEKHSVRLPEDYRIFLTAIGNGGTELFKLGEMDDSFDFRPWDENDGFVGALSEPFQYSEAWNDLSAHPIYEAGKESDDEWLKQYDHQRDLFDQTYFLPLNGAIPISHLGCAIRLWLVITGPERGNVWHDDRANGDGLKPLLTSDGCRLSFLEWCKGWPNG